MREISLIAGIVFLGVMAASIAVVSWRAATDVHTRCPECDEQMTGFIEEPRYRCTNRHCPQGVFNLQCVFSVAPAK